MIIKLKKSVSEQAAKQPTIETGWMRKNIMLFEKQEWPPLGSHSCFIPS
ncbi:MAG: hypothetical protein MSL26_11455 [Clostridiales bacterium]|nr:hypothetical protein [Clostridiales bacterium]